MDILKRIEELCKTRKISFYKLSKKSGISTNTIYKWFKTNQTPSLDSLKLICEKGFQITMFEFFYPETNLIPTTPEIKELVELYSKLNPVQKNAIKQVMLSY